MIASLRWWFPISLPLLGAELERIILEDHTQKLFRCTERLAIYDNVQPPLASLGLCQVTLQHSLVLGRPSLLSSSAQPCGRWPPSSGRASSRTQTWRPAASPPGRTSPHPRCAARQLGIGLELGAERALPFPPFLWPFPCWLTKTSFSNRPCF